MKNFKLVFAASASMLALLAASSAAQAAPGLACKPRIEGPVAFDAKPYQRVDKPAAGMVGEEFFLSCNTSAGPYKTLVQVRMPKDAAKQSGIVVVEPDQIHIYPKTGDYMSRAGHVDIVVISSARLLDAAKKSNPARYGSLNLPSGPDSGHTIIGTETYETPAEFEVLAQAGQFIKDGGIPGIKARKVILSGMSYFGGVVRGYIGWEHPKPGMKSVFDGYFPTQARKSSYKTPLADLDVPVMDLEGERELQVLPYVGEPVITYRRPDSAVYRLYEVPGMPHDVTRGAAEAPGNECKGRTVSDFPNNAVYSAVLDRLVAWIDKGKTPPRVPWITTSADGKDIKRDQFGNALGGYRISYMDVPVATYHSLWDSYSMVGDKPSDATALACDKVGWIAPLTKTQLQALYPTHADYVAKVNKSLDQSVAQGTLLPEDAQDLKTEAQGAKIP